MQGPALSRFELHEELGSGSNGTVYRAVARTRMHGVAPGDEVAIKFLRQDLLADEAARRLFLEEGRIGRAVRSPHIVRIHAVEAIPFMGLDLTYLVMELLRGRTVRRLLEEVGPPVEDLTRRIGREAALGLSALHRRAVVHRDIKPENICLTEEGTVKIMDLGLARQNRPKREQGRPRPGGAGSPAFFGTLLYAPARTLRTGEADEDSDLHALGVVLYELATGKHPYFEDRHSAVLEEEALARLEQPPPRPGLANPALSPFLEEVILALLDPQARPRLGGAEGLARVLDIQERSPFWTQRLERASVEASRARLRRVMRFSPTPLLDRGEEMEALEEALASAARGRPAGVVLTGPLGIGRRRLAMEAVERWLTREEPMVFLAGRAGPAREEGPAAPFGWMLVDHLLEDPDLDQGPLPAQARLPRRALLENRLVGAGLASPDEAASLAPVLLPDPQEPSPPPAPDLLARWIAALGSGERTVVLLVERAERLTEEAAAVLQRLLRTGRGRVLALLVQLSLQRLPPPLEELAGDGAAPLRLLPVRPLAASAFAEFCGALFGGRVEGTLLGRRFHAQLGGNPGHLLASLEALAGRGALSGRPGHFRLEQDVEEAPLPPRVGRLFDEQVAGMTEPVRPVLEVAAVLGDRCTLEDLEALTGRNRLELLQTLSSALGTTVRVEGRQVRFAHRGLRQALLRAVPAPRRVALHRAAARWLEGRGMPALAVGLHWSQAGVHGRAVVRLLAAVEDLVREGDLARARRVAERVRLHLGALPPARARLLQRLRLQLLRGGIFSRLSAHQEARRAFTKALHLARFLEHHRGSGDALLGLSRLAWQMGFLLASLQYLEPAQAAFARAAYAEGLARTEQARALVLGFLGRVREGLEQAARSVARLARAGRTADRALAAEGWLLLGRFHGRRAHPSRALECFGRAAALFGGAGNQEGTCRVLYHRARLLLQFGLDEEAAGDLGRALAIVGSRHLPRMTGRLLQLSAERALARGQAESALARAEEAMAAARRTKDPWLEAEARRTVAMVLLGLPRPQAQRALGEAGLAAEAGRELGGPRLTVLSLLALSAALGALDRWPEALERADEALSIVRRLQLGVDPAARLERQRARALGALGRTREAARALRRAASIEAALARRLAAARQRLPARREAASE